MDEHHARATQLGAYAAQVVTPSATPVYFRQIHLNCDDTLRRLTECSAEAELYVTPQLLRNVVSRNVHVHGNRYRNR
jgi:hypothetical protein